VALLPALPVLPRLAAVLPAVVVALAVAALAHWRARARRATAAVLVIGGTGLMGVPTVRRLLGQGRRVVVLSRGRQQGQGTQGRRPAQPIGVEEVMGDRTNGAELVKLLTSEGCPRTVVDFTAMRPEHLEPVLEAHSVRPLDHYIFISTNMIYPGGPEGMDISGLPQPVAESSADLRAAESAPDTYGGRKLRCEAMLRRAYAAQGFPATVLRPPAVVGPGCDERHERLQRFVLDMPPLPPKRSAALAAQPGRFRVAYSDDVAAAIAAAIMHGSAVYGEAFNVASEESTTLGEYTAALAEAAGVPPPAGPPEDLGSRNYERQGQIDICKAQRVLGYHSTPMASWMRTTAAWHAPLLRGAVTAGQ